MTSHEWGRVEDDGTVYVRTADGERAVGQYPEGTPEEALAFFTERYAALAFEVELLEQRVNSGVLTAEEAAESVKTVRAQVTDANAVGDLAGLVGRLNALGPIIASQREARRAEKAQRSAEAKAAKEKLVAEAEKLAESDDWRNGANRLRDLLEQWKALPRIDRASDDALWKRFRGAQDAFFGARDAANAAQDQEFAANAEVKEKLLVEAEALLPVTDVEAAKRAFRDLADRWDEAGKVPRDRMKDLEGRMRKVEQAIRGVEEEQWKRSDPEKSARADDMIGKLEAAIAKVEADIERARAAGDDKRVRDLEDNLASRRQFLEMARRASADFSG